MVDFGNRLKTLRLRENMTQAQLAQKLGLTKSVISAYETGLRLLSYDILIHIAKIYNVSTDYLLGVENKQYLDLSGLSTVEKYAVINLIQTLKQKKIAPTFVGAIFSYIPLLNPALNIGHSYNAYLSILHSSTDTPESYKKSQVLHPMLIPFLPQIILLRAHISSVTISDSHS